MIAWETGIREGAGHVFDLTKILEQIRQLDPVRVHQRIVFLSGAHEFPFDNRRLGHKVADARVGGRLAAQAMVG